MDETNPAKVSSCLPSAAPWDHALHARSTTSSGKTTPLQDLRRNWKPERPAATEQAERGRRSHVDRQRPGRRERGGQQQRAAQYARCSKLGASKRGGSGQAPAVRAWASPERDQAGASSGCGRRCASHWLTEHSCSLGRVGHRCESAELGLERILEPGAQALGASSRARGRGPTGRRGGRRARGRAGHCSQRRGQCRSGIRAALRLRAVRLPVGGWVSQPSAPPALHRCSCHRGRAIATAGATPLRSPAPQHPPTAESSSRAADGLSSRREQPSARIRSAAANRKGRMSGEIKANYQRAGYLHKLPMSK